MEDSWTPEYSPWRHGGWYVTNVHYPNGACGCVSRNYPDKKWRIVCDRRPDAYDRYTYRNRDEAARAERELAAERQRTNPAVYVLVRRRDNHLFGVFDNRDLAKQAEANAQKRWPEPFAIYQHELNAE